MTTTFLCVNAYSEPIYQAHTTVDVISDIKSITPGQNFWIGLHLKLDPDWHIYWKNAGDSGLPPVIELKLPKGFKAKDIQWPYPQRINVGPLTSFGYENEVILWREITSPSSIDRGTSLPMDVNVKWLACKVDCIPGQASFKIEFLVTETPISNPKGQQALEKTRQLWPITSDEWIVNAFNQEDHFLLTLQSLNDHGSMAALEFFPDDNQLIDHALKQLFSPSIVREGSRAWTLTIPKSSLLKQQPQRIKGVLVQQNAWDAQGQHQALKIDIPLQHQNPLTPTTLKASINQPSFSFIVMCGFAFLGGIILNFMPCVLPVLSLKILGLIKKAQNPKQLLTFGIMFSAGIIISFWSLAGLLILLKSAGHELGWGFQFQSPLFVTAMAILFFILGLNLLGIFEITINVNLKQHRPQQGYLDSFLSGVLTTITATPCTAPFMGTAVGFALSQSWVTALVIFTFLGLGLAFPFVVLCRFTQFLKFVPKPGPWMITLKTVLGFILLACVVWLIWVLGLQKGINSVLVVLSGLWLIGFSLWGWGRLQENLAHRAVKIFIIIVGLGTGCLTLMGIYLLPTPTTYTTALTEHEIPWDQFSLKKLEQLRLEGKAVFIDFTAAWCLTCQVNDKLIFQNKKVVDAFKNLGIIGLKADWTNYDPKITQALESYGKNSIPTYIFYRKGQDEPIVLPEVMTVEYLVQTLKRY